MTGCNMPGMPDGSKPKGTRGRNALTDGDPRKMRRDRKLTPPGMANVIGDRAAQVKASAGWAFSGDGGLVRWVGGAKTSLNQSAIR